MKPINSKFTGSGPGSISVNFNNGSTVVVGYIVQQLNENLYEVTANGTDKFKVKLADTTALATALTPGYCTIPVKLADGSTDYVKRFVGTSVLYTTGGARITWGTLGTTPAAGAGILRTVLGITGTPGAAVVGTAYSFVPVVTGGSGTKTFALVGTLPAGLTFSTSTGAIAGTPTTAGSLSGISIVVTDSAGGLPATLSGLAITVSAGIPVLGPLTASYSAMSAAGSVITSITGLQAGETAVSLSPNNGYVIITGGNTLSVGPVPYAPVKLFYSVKTSTGRVFDTVLTSASASTGPASPAAITNTNGSVSVPAGAARPGSSVEFFVEGTKVGAAIAASDGSATLTNPLFPPAAGAVVTYGPIPTTPSVVASGSVIPAMTIYNNAFTSSQNNLLTWTIQKTSGTNATPNTNTLSIVNNGDNTYTINTIGSGENSYISLNPTLAPGTYTLGMTVVLLSDTGLIRPVFFFPSYAQPAGSPVLVKNTPIRLSATLTVTNSGTQSFALADTAGAGVCSYKIYNVTLSTSGSDAFKSTGTLDAPQACPTQAPSVDYAMQFLTYPSWPTDAPFTNAAATPTACALKAGATNVAYYDFTPTGNCTTREMLDKHFFYNGVNNGYAPNLRKVLDGNNPKDGVDGTVSYARMRRFPKGHPYDLHKFTSEGLYLDVVATQNDAKPYKWPPLPYGTGPATVFAGNIRPQTIFRPGMVAEFIIRSPSDVNGWGPTWLHGHTQISPGRIPASNGDPTFGDQGPWAGFTPGPVQTDLGNAYKLFYPLRHKNVNVYGEFDIPDAWVDPRDLTKNGRTMSAGIVQLGNPSTDEVDGAYHLFKANSDGYTYYKYPGTDVDFVYRSSGNLLSEGLHSFILNWRNDGSNIIDFICDGTIFLQGYKEYYADMFWNVLTHQSEQLGMMALIGGQYGPGFANQNPFTPDGGTKGLLIAGYRAWIGNIDLSASASPKVTMPVNGLKPYPAVTLSSLTANANVPWSVTIGNVQASGTRVRAASSDNTPLTITITSNTDSNGVVTKTYTLTGTFTAAGTSPKVTITQTPYVANDVGTGVVTKTDLTVAIAAAPTQVPSNSTVPTISGIAQQGVTLTASTGTWTNSPSSYAYQWMAGGANVGTNANTYVPTSADVGKTITVSVTATNNVGPSTAATSTATSAVVAVSVTVVDTTGSNLLASGTDFSGWTIPTATGTAGLALTTGQADVDGGTGATKVVPSATAGYHYAVRAISGLDTTKNYVFGVTAKAAGYRYLTLVGDSSGPRATFDLQTGTVVNGGTGGAVLATKITDVGNGFYACRIMVKPTSAAPGFQAAISTSSTDVNTFTGDGTSGQIWARTFVGLAATADSPAGTNLLTSQTIGGGGSGWTINQISSVDSITVTGGKTDVAGGTTAQLAVPTATSGIHRFNRSFTLNAANSYSVYARVKRSGVGTGSRYLYLNFGTAGQACFDLQDLKFVVDGTGNNVPAGCSFTVLAGGFIQVGMRLKAGATSTFLYVQGADGLSTTDYMAPGVFTGDGTSGLVFDSIFVGTV